MSREGAKAQRQRKKGQRVIERVSLVRKAVLVGFTPFEKEGRGIFPMLPYNRRLKTKARSLRTHPTDAELHLWYRLRRKQILGVQFYRQKPIGNYIADFYAPAAKLVIELDGAQHLQFEQATYDAQRTRDLEQHGLKVLRFEDRQVLLQTESVLEMIFQAMKNPS